MQLCLKLDLAQSNFNNSVMDTIDLVGGFMITSAIIPLIIKIQRKIRQVMRK